MADIKTSIFAAALLIAGALLAGFSLLADSMLILVGFGCMLLGILLPFSKPIASYFRSFTEYPDKKTKK